MQTWVGDRPERGDREIEMGGRGGARERERGEKQIGEGGSLGCDNNFNCPKMSCVQEAGGRRDFLCAFTALYPSPSLPSPHNSTALHVHMSRPAKTDLCQFGLTEELNFFPTGD